jgi:hypothetical protein
LGFILIGSREMQKAVSDKTPLQGVSCHGFTKQEPLHLVTFPVPQKLTLRLVFHTFCHDRNAQRMRHGKDSTHDSDVLAPAGQPTHERAVDFKPPDRETFEQ